MGTGLTTWGRSHDFAARRLLEPTSIAALQEIVAPADRVRAIGTRHSFSDLADTTGDLVSLARMPQGIAVLDGVADVPAAMRYGDLAPALHERGWALANLASLPHISVAGAIATATHGSGDRNGTLATSVAWIDLMDAAGTILRVHRGEPGFDGLVVSLGAAGIVTRVGLDVVPTFDVRQDAYSGLGWAALVDGLDEVFASGYSVSVFTRWEGDDVGGLLVKSRVSGGTLEPPATIGDAVRGEVLEVAPAQAVDDAHTVGHGIPGAWSERLAHFRLDGTPSVGDELQGEWAVPRVHARDAVLALRALGDRLAPVLHGSELRTVRADEHWLSGAYRTDVLAIGFTWKHDRAGVDAVTPLVERALLPLGARPHWGKLFQADPRPAFPRWHEFAELVRERDPRGTFRGPFLDRYL